MEITRSIPETLTELGKDTFMELNFKELANVILDLNRRVTALEDKLKEAQDQNAS